MGKVNIYTAPVGAGKTHKAICDFTQRLSERDPLFSESHCYFIVPEQFSVDVEKKVLEKAKGCGFAGSEVISFTRLAHRIVAAENPGEKRVISKSARIMLLMDTVKKIESSLTFFKSCGERPASVSYLSDAIDELSKNGVETAVIEAAAADAELSYPEDKVTPMKLRELAIIKEKYQEQLSTAYMDGNLLAEQAARLIMEGKSELSDGCVFIDSFTGFTGSELKLIKAMALAAEEVNIYLFEDDPENILFSCAEKSLRQLRREVKNPYIELNELKIVPEDSSEMRFGGSPELMHISKYYPKLQDVAYNGEACGNIIPVVAPNFYYEIEAAAVRIRGFLKEGYRPSQIAVVIPDIDRNYPLAETVFREKKVPCFIDARTSMTTSPGITFVNAFLRIIGEGFDTEGAMRLLKTGLYKGKLFDRDTADSLEVILSERGIKTERNWRSFIEKQEKKYGESLPKSIMLGKELLASADEAREDARKCRTVNDCLNVLLDFIRQAEAETGIAKIAESASPIFTRIWNVLTDIIAECGEVLGKTAINGYRKLFSYVGDIIGGAISGYCVGSLPAFIEAVQVGDIGRSKYIDKKIIMVLGANEGSFPAGIENTGFLGDREREVIENAGGLVSFNMGERIILGRFNIYNVLLSASEKLYISCSLTDGDGGEIFPAEAYNKILKLFPDIRVREYEVRKSEPPADSVYENIDGAVVKELLQIAEKYKTSASQLGTYIDCPYKFFVSKVLHLGEKDSGKLQKNIIGSFMHELFETSIRRAREDGKFSSAENPDWEKYVGEAAESFFADPDNEKFAGLKENSAKNSFFIKRAVEFADNECKKILGLAERSGFRPEFEELKFGEGEFLPAVRVDAEKFAAEFSGSIDRVDVGSDKNGEPVIAAVDYKTREIKPESIINGLEIQMAVYYSALKNGKEKLAERLGTAAFVYAMSYYRYGKIFEKGANQTHGFLTLVNGEPGDKALLEEKLPAEAKQKKAYNFDRLEEENFERIRAAANGIARGEFPVRPRDEKSCKYCKNYIFCGYKAGSSDDGQEVTEE